MAVKILSNTDSGGLVVNTRNEATVALTTDENYAGYAAVAACHDDGSVTSSRDILELDASNDYRLRVGMDNIVWNDWFSDNIC